MAQSVTEIVAVSFIRDKVPGGRVYIGSTHSMPHGTQHNRDNNFDGHMCIHFPRTAAQVASIGPYATSHQTAIDAGWRITYVTADLREKMKAQRKKIEQSAQGILDTRALYPDCSLADLYDEATMPPELRTAHQKNDRAVMEAYGFWGKLNSESACVAELMKLYQQLTAQA